MSEKMLVTQALEERDVLIRKINNKIEKASFTDTIQPKNEKVFFNQINKEDYTQQAYASWQQIMDLIDRFERIDAAIVISNSNTYITTSYGRLSIAEALSIQSRIEETGIYESDASFERKLLRKMQAEYNKRIQFCVQKNSQLQTNAEKMRLSLLQKTLDPKDENLSEIVDTYIHQNTSEIVDPLDILKKIDALTEKRNTLLYELETQIKISNATTFIEII